MMTPEEHAALDRHAADAIVRLGPLSAFREMIAENDALIRGPQLDNGRLITVSRTAAYSALMANWAAERHRMLGYDKPFAVVALGGTGRQEVTPYSDTDFAFLFYDAIEGNSFLLELER